MRTCSSPSRSDFCQKMLERQETSASKNPSPTISNAAPLFPDLLFDTLESSATLPGLLSYLEKDSKKSKVDSKDLKRRLKDHLFKETVSFFSFTPQSLFFRSRATSSSRPFPAHATSNARIARCLRSTFHQQLAHLVGTFVHKKP